MTVGLSAHVTDALPHMRSAFPGSLEATGEDRLTRAQPPGLSASLPEGFLLYFRSWLSLRARCLRSAGDLLSPRAALNQWRTEACGLIPQLPILSGTIRMLLVSPELHLHLLILITHPLGDFFPILSNGFTTPSLRLPDITSPVYSLRPNPSLRVCFGGTILKQLPGVSFLASDINKH